MTPATTLHTAAAALQRNRMRSALCAASPTIGVAAVLAIVALGRGARAIVEAQVMSAGTNVVIVSAGNWTAGGVRLGMGSSSVSIEELQSLLFAIGQGLRPATCSASSGTLHRLLSKATSPDGWTGILQRGERSVTRSNLLVNRPMS